MSLIPILICGLAFLTACSGKVQAQEDQDCPITQPQNPIFIPPQPWPSASPYENIFWYGSENLWTKLQTDGTWRSLPDDDGGMVQKLVWWHAGYNWQEDPMPDIGVRGRRLDSEAPEFEFSGGTNTYHPDVESAMLIGASIPSLGCWEITGFYENEQLSYVVLIVED